MSKEEENALKNLRKDETITILPADKGKSVVVMDSKEYKENVSTLLVDTKTYSQLTDKRLNPTTRVEKDLNKLLLNIKVDNTGTTPQIGPSLYEKLHCNNSTPASFYGLPKIHKPERPLRPITSSIGSPTYAVSKHLVSILAPLRKNSYTVRNSSEFVHELRQYSIADDEIMVSFDVKSLFTSIPVDLALTITKERLQKDQNLAERTNMSVTNVMKLLDFVLTNNYFKHDGHHYKQIFGCAMGSPISLVLVDLVMEVIEETAIITALHPPKWWFRYVDDSHSCLKKDQVDAFHQHLNSINANIQFTLELEDANGYGLPFLDTVTSRRGTAIQVEVYRKPTHTDRYLDFLSHHPSCHKRSVVKTLLLRASNIPSTSKGKREEAQRVKAVLRENNYPSGFIKECERALATKPSQPTTNGFVVLPYVRGVSERIGRVLKQQSLRVSFQPQRTINSLFPRPKQQDETDRPSSGIVYRINCSQCDFVYYGQTERALKTLGMITWSSQKSTNALHALKFSRVTRIQHAQRFNLKVFKSRVTSSGFFN